MGIGCCPARLPHGDGASGAAPVPAEAASGAGCCACLAPASRAQKSARGPWIGKKHQIDRRAGLDGVALRWPPVPALVKAQVRGLRFLRAQCADADETTERASGGAPTYKSGTFCHWGGRRRSFEGWRPVRRAAASLGRPRLWPAPLLRLPSPCVIRASARIGRTGSTPLRSTCASPAAPPAERASARPPRAPAAAANSYTGIEFPHGPLPGPRTGTIHVHVTRRSS